MSPANRQRQLPGTQTGETVRRMMESLRCRPFFGSGWKVLIVNEADAMTPNAAFVWLNALEGLPPQTVIIFTTNDAGRIPARLRDMGWFSATFTPRGRQHWTYEVFGQTDAEGRPLRPNTALFKARTKDIPFLPHEFYDTIKDQYSSALTAQELEGEFTDLEGAMFRRRWFPIDDQAPPAEETADMVHFF